MAKKIVVFADGTGNAFTTQESNVWRLYEALDQTDPNQIAHYIQGVGTSGFKPFAALDVATGIGVPSNVRKLYEFISWNWQEGDEIYMFGFSRGSFTIRTLIGMMHYEGLVPVQIGDKMVSHADMNRNVMSAWRSYRSRTIPWWKTAPTVWLARSIRNVMLGVVHLAGRILFGHPFYFTVAEKTETQKRTKVPVKFVGLFDTVEAFGVPIEEFRSAIDWAIWPISFRNATLSERVVSARHALSLDDERTAFHPLRIDRLTAKDQARIKEVWFAGVHSDVGGGYPEDDLALVPLNWMVGEIGNNLTFIDGAKKLLAEKASPYASVHDSRSGLGVLYRYCPREVGDNGGPPLIHHSVAEKIVFGTDRYAPVTLPDTADVLMPDGTPHRIQGFSEAKMMPPGKTLAPPMSPEMERAVRAVESLSEPDPAIVSLTLDAIWRRRVAYFSLLLAVLLIGLLPWIVKPVVETFRRGMQWFANHTGWGSTWQHMWDSMAYTDLGSSAFLGSVLPFLGSLLPGYVKPWSEALMDRPTACVLLFLEAALLYLWNSSLRDRINDFARQAWLPGEKVAAIEKMKKKAAKEAEKKSKAKSETPISNTISKWIRESKVAAFLEVAVSRYALPSLAILLIYGAFFVSISRSTVTYVDGSGYLCRNNQSPASVTLAPGKTVSRDDFVIDQPCWTSGIQLEKGRHYTLWIEMTEPFFDQTIMTDIAGFTDSSWRHRFAWPIRRWWSADWFQPIARIGRTGTDTWPLVSVDGDVAIEAGKDVAGSKIPKQFYKDDSYKDRLKQLNAGKAEDDPSRLAVDQKIPAAELAAARAIREKYQLRKIYVSNFMARSDGELILYVNDAIAAVPQWKVFTTFYANNTGRAKVTVQQLASPPPPRN